MKLIRLEGPAARDLFDVEGPQAIIGRAPDCDVILFDPQASRRHARLWYDGDEYVIEDLQGANPSLVNDRILMEPRRLIDGDLIVIGGVVLLVELDVPTSEGIAEDVADQDDVETSSDGSPSQESRSAPAEGSSPEREVRTARFTRPGPPSAPRSDILPPTVSAALPSEAGHGTARRLDAVARRLQARASALRGRDRQAISADVAGMDTIIDAHEHLGGDAALARLAGLLHDRLSNQTDIRALYRLGAETEALVEWVRLARQSIAEVSKLASSLDLR